MSAHPDRDVRLAEEIEAQIAELLEFASRRGELARDAVQPRHGRPAPVITTRRDKPDISDRLRNDLRAALEDDIIPASQAGGPDGIQESDLERELAKKALVGLRLDSLRRLASAHRLDKRGRSEDVAERIAAALHYDEEAIARLVLENQEEPEPERGHTTRIFPLAAPILVSSASTRLNQFVGRYIRVGVARWFVFEGAEADASYEALVVTGSLRSYTAMAASREDEPYISSSPSETEIQLEVSDAGETLKVSGANASQARAAGVAFDAASGERMLGYFPIGRDGLRGLLATFDTSTVLMLDLIYNRLPRLGVSRPNLTVARFRLREERVAFQEDETETPPSLRAVRFEGDHLLDSAPACQLIAQDLRALVDVSLTVSVHVNQDEEARFPVRITLERDHIVVMTGFGRFRSERSVLLHAQLVGLIEQAVGTPVADLGRLEELAARIAARARTTGPVRRSTILE